MEIFPADAQHIGSRKEQQDAFGISDPRDSAFIMHGGVLAVVADGMGGLAEGGKAAQLAVSSFLDAYARKSPGEPIDAALYRAIIETNDAVHSLAAELKQEGNCGTTLVAAVAHESGLYWIYAGDSRIYLTDGQALQQLTEDQVYGRRLDQAADRGLIDPETALLHPEREALTSYIGDEVINEVGRGCLPGPLPDGASVLLCTDGLYKFLQEERIIGTYTEDPAKWVKRLVETVIGDRLPGQDNVTAVCLHIRSAGPASRKAATRRNLVALIAIGLSIAVTCGSLYFYRSRLVSPGSGENTLLVLSADILPASPGTEKKGVSADAPH